MQADELISIEVVYCCQDEQHVVALSVATGTTADEAIRLSGLSAHCPHFHEYGASIGIHGRVVGRDTVLEDGDRVEIYRPLVADPKQARRRRASRER